MSVRKRVVLFLTVVDSVGLTAFERAVRATERKPTVSATSSTMAATTERSPRLTTKALSTKVILPPTRVRGLWERAIRERGASVEQLWGRATDIQRSVADEVQGLSITGRDPRTPPIGRPETKECSQCCPTLFLRPRPAYPGQIHYRARIPCRRASPIRSPSPSSDGRVTGDQ